MKEPVRAVIVNMDGTLERRMMPAPVGHFVLPTYQMPDFTDAPSDERSAPDSVGIVRYWRLGTLPDGAYVYVSDQSLGVWDVEHSLSVDLLGDRMAGGAELDFMFRVLMPRPFVIVYSRVTVGEHGLLIWRVCGVTVRRPRRS